MKKSNTFKFVLKDIRSKISKEIECRINQLIFDSELYELAKLEELLLNAN